MKGPELLQQYTDIIKTKMGGFIPEVRAIFRGHDLHKDLKDMDWLELYAFGITGQRFTAEQMRVMHALFVFTSYPEPRLWNNRVAALAGSSRSTGCQAISAALSVSEATIYGGGNYSKAADLFLRAHKEKENGNDLTAYVVNEIKTKRGISGYGRPVSADDERKAPLMAVACKVGLDKGPHVRLAFEIEDILINGRWRRHLNAAGLYAAFLTDFGFSPKETYLFMFPVFMAGMLPCFIEASEKPEGTLLPLSCSHIAYEGTEKRVWR
jgi:hypothetical protein